MNRVGFTIVELIIVLAIIGVMLGLVSIRFLQVNEKTVVKNTAIDLASSLRGARSNTVIGQESSSGTTSWGVYVDLSGATQALIFNDEDGDGVYGSTDLSEEIEFNPNAQVVACEVNRTSLTTCGVLFQAPQATAQLFTNDATPLPDPATQLQITVSSRSDTSLEEQVTLTAPSGLIETSVQL